MYPGLEPMGLVWSMQPEKLQKKGVRLSKRDVTTPMITFFSVYDGHFDASEENDNLTELLLVQKTYERWYLGENVHRREIRENGLKATFFIPKGNPLSIEIKDI